METWLKKSLEDLQLDYLDLYLIHTPFAFEEVEGDLHPVNENGEIRLDVTTDHLAVWAEMEKQVVAGRARAIGLSNFNISQVTRILNVARVPVSNLQIELHVYFQQKELVSIFLFSFFYFLCLFQNKRRTGKNKGISAHIPFVNVVCNCL